MLPAGAFSKALREAAPSLSKRFFECTGRRYACQFGKAHPQAQSSPGTTQRPIINRSVRQLSTKPIRFTGNPLDSELRCSVNSSPGRSSPTRFIRTFSQSVQARNQSSGVGNDDHAQEKDNTHTGEGNKKQKSSFPDTSSNVVAYWLLGSAASVFGIVVFGGLTRLTESGYVKP